MEEEKKDENELSIVENLTIGTISALGTILLYGTGVNLSKTVPNGEPIFIGTVFLSFISPYLLKTSSTYILKKNHERKTNHQKKKH